MHPEEIPAEDRERFRLWSMGVLRPDWPPPRRRIGGTVPFVSSPPATELRKHQESRRRQLAILMNKLNRLNNTI